jgi:diacylglycerol kinase family enzyme
MGLPAFVNPDGGSARAALSALEEDGGFDVRLTRPGELPRLLAAAVEAGATRVLVAGGDGTIRLAAAALAGTPVGLAVLPAGTLNHFARGQGIPTDPSQALALARGGTVRPADVGYVNDRLFLNTSSIGAYVRFVRTRDRIERFTGYWAASFVAGLRVLGTLELIPVRLAAQGEARVYRTPLVFVGVGERSFTAPGLGQPLTGGARGLHVVLPRGRLEARPFARAYGRVARGLPVSPRSLGLDAAVVTGLRVDLPERYSRVALDGETEKIPTPLEYRFQSDALRVVVPGMPA